MGCTSSAQNTPPSYTNSEKDMSMTEDLHRDEETVRESNEIFQHKETEMNGIKVLPTCDTLDEPTQLDRNNKTFVDISTPEPEQVSSTRSRQMELTARNNLKELNGTLTTKDFCHPNIGANQNFLKSDDASIHNSPGMKISKSEEKLSKLEEVVEKVVELYVENTCEKSQDDSAKTEGITMTKIENKESSFAAADPSKAEENEIDELKEILGEMVSPTQSPSNRATRWEALADIAAELPPSLTVDPHTGQIYAVSK